MDPTNDPSASGSTSPPRHQTGPRLQASWTRSEDEELARRYEEQIMLSAKKEQIASTLRAGIAGFIGRPADAYLPLEISAEAKRLLGAALGEEFDVDVEVEGEDGQFNVIIRVK